MHVGVGGAWHRNAEPVFINPLGSRYGRNGFCACGGDLTPADDPVLKRFGAALDTVYGPWVVRVVLYRSRPRGDARPESDYDVAVFLSDLTDRWGEMDLLADIGTEIPDDQGKLVHAMAYSARAYRERTPLMHEIRQDGIDL
jgi:predicted nucleotidyltransferase